MSLLGAHAPGFPVEAQADDYIIRDPAGDAYEFNGQWLEYAQPCPVVDPGELANETEVPCRPAGDALNGYNGAVPAPPALDLTGVRFEESATHVRFIVEVASLPDDFGGFYDRDEGRWSLVSLDWQTSVLGHDCVQGLDYYGLVAIDAFTPFVVLDTICTPSGDGLTAEGVPCMNALCGLPVSSVVQPGAPGRFIFDVERAHLANGNAGAMLTGIKATMSSGLGDRAGGLYVNPSGTVSTNWYSPLNMGYPNIVDETTATDVTLTRPMRELAQPARTLSQDEDFFVATPRARPEMDILTYEMVETESDLIFQLELLTVADGGPDFTLGMYAGLAEAQAVWGVGFSQVAGERVPFSWGVDREGNPAPLTFDLNVTRGSPGLVSATVPRNQLPAIEVGDRVSYGLAVTEFVNTTYLSGGAAQGVRVDEYSLGDVSDFLPLLYFQYASEPETDGAVRIRDVTGDVLLPADATGNPSFSSPQYDLTSVDLESLSHDELRVSMSVASLTDFAVPLGYDGALHAVAFETPRGDVMAGHYLTPGASSGEFFCAADTVGFAPSPRDPQTLSGRWTTIPGRVAAAAEGGGRTGAAATGEGGSIMFFVPRSCFGAGPEVEAVTADSVRAFTYLFRTPAGRSEATAVEMLDEAYSDGAVSIPYAPAAAGPAVPSNDPFGIDNFWDKMGVLVAILFTLISAIIIVGKRMRMKRYLVELERLADTHHDDATVYAGALVALRGELFSDFLSNRLTEGHFVMIEERLRSSLSAARINAFGRAFYDLPPALMIRLQSLLADGRFSKQDHQVLDELIGLLKIPATSRKSVREQIALWVDQDAAVGRVSRWQRRGLRARVRDRAERAKAQSQ